MKLWFDETFTRKQRNFINQRNFLLDKEEVVELFEKNDYSHKVEYFAYLEASDFGKTLLELGKEYSLLLTGTELLTDFEVTKILKIVYNKPFVCVSVKFNISEYLKSLN